MPQQGKGDRHQFTVRVPADQAVEYQREAAKYGLKDSDYLALKLAEVHGLEPPKWLRSVDQQQEVFPKTA